MELRVHGIGDHGSLSSQGSGIQLRSAAQTDGVLLYQAPSPPGHDLRFVNWTRTARSRVPLTWYLVLPFTLLNMASFMKPRAGAGLHRALVTAWGAVLTVTSWLWLVLCVETVIRYVYPADASLDPGRIAAWWLAAGVCVLLTARALVHRERHSGLLPVALLHSVLVLATAWLIIGATPAADTGPGDTRCWVGEPGRSCVVFEGDVTSRVAFVSMAVAVGIALLLAALDLVSKDRTWSDTDADPWLGSGLLILVSTVLLNVGWSAVRLIIDWGLRYLESNLGVVFRADRQEFSGAVLLPWQQGLYGPDMVVGIFTPVVLGAVILLVIALLVRLIRRQRLSHLRSRVRRARAEAESASVAFPDDDPRLAALVGLLEARRIKKKDRAVAVHDFVCESRTPRLVSVTVVVTCIVAVPTTLWLRYAPTLNSREGWIRVPSFLPGPERVDFLRGLTVISVHLLFLLIALVLISPGFRKPFAVMGDVIGYWDMAVHPLAGVPYAPDVVSYLDKEVRDVCAQGESVVVLTGHSQGSVLAFKAAQGLLDLRPGRVVLVTCGSPLRSLYSRYFPLTFTATARNEVVEGLGGWLNFWRATDPIACPLFGPRASDAPAGVTPNGNVPSTDILLEDPPPPLPGGQRSPLVPLLRQHSDYWLDETQVRLVREVHDGTFGLSGDDALRKVDHE